MTRWFVRIVLGLVGLVLALAIAVTFVDWNSYRDRIARAVSDQLGLAVRLGGEIRLSLLPGPAFAAEAVSISAPLSGEPVAVADRIAVDLDLFDLLQGQVSIGSLELDGVSLTVEQVAGAWQVRGWPVADGAQNGTQSSDAGANGISIGALKLRNGRLSVIRPDAAPILLETIGGTLSGTLPTGPLDWAVGFAVGGEEVAVSGRLRPVPISDTQPEDSRTAGTELSVRTDIVLGGTVMTISGRLLDDGGLNGRMVLEGDNLSDLMARGTRLASAVMAGDEDTTPSKPLGPNIPHKLDMQVERRGNVTRLVSRTLSLGETSGNLDLTIVERDKLHLAGTLALGILDIGPWLQGTEEARDNTTGRSGEDSQAGEDARESDIVLPFAGTLDVSVEGIALYGGVVQQLDAGFAFRDDRIALTRGQALMPGGTSLSLAGDVFLSTGRLFSGTLNVDSGNLPDLIKWAGLSIPGDVRPGRLATARLAAGVDITDDDWQLSGIKGQIDTSRFAGGAIGSMNGTVRQIQLTVSDVNLDAYLDDDMIRDALSESEESASSDRPDTLHADAPGTVNLAFPWAEDTGTDIMFDVNMVHWRGRRYDRLRAEALLLPDGVQIETVSLEEGNGRLALRGSISRRADRQNTPKSNGVDWGLTANLSVERWTLPLLRAHLPESLPYLDALGAKAISGGMTLQGDSRQMRVSVETSLLPEAQDGEAARLALNGDISMLPEAGNLSGFDLQGQLDHADLAPLARLMGADMVQSVPVDVTFTAVSAPQPATGPAGGAPRQPVQLRISGALAGGQMTVSGVVDDGADLALTYTHPTAVNATSQLMPLMPLADEMAPLSLEARLIGDAAAGDDDGAVANWSLQDVILRNGAGSVSGMLGLRDGRNLSGRLAVAGLDVSSLSAGHDGAPVTGDAAAEPTRLSASLSPLEDMRGTVALTLQTITLYGQRLTAPNAALILTGQTVRLSLGEGAQLNDGTLTGDVVVSGGSTPGFTGNLSASRIDLAAALTGSGLRPVLSGQAQAQMDLGARGDTVNDMIAALTGEVTVTGYAGSLNFLGVPGLVRSIENADSPRAFLGGIGGFLKDGESRFTAMETRITLDEGVALIERFGAEGDWGQFNLDGQVNLADALMDIRGQLSLSRPLDAPAIPVRYQGPLSGPSVTWQSRLLERFVLAGIERKLRATLLNRFETQDAAAQTPAETNPGAAVFGRAFDVLKKLQEQQKAQKQKNNTKEDDRDGTN
ncbi:AsmA family protein [Eilatimonas milleporae]|uniref:AsmA-like protein n=1 Tax=Eilatimonas milleporae TaxID=911205 RepID=A0A3M0CSB9_9PROT|nr:AsmA family protein [Eilatimonas milleporae]RMB11755.1 AsmA-like protein [Eilatimonas milleporae]